MARIVERLRHLVTGNNHEVVRSAQARASDQQDELDAARDRFRAELERLQAAIRGTKNGNGSGH